MGKLQDTFRNIFKIHELRQRILYTLALLVVVRLGAHITLPGIDSYLLSEAMANKTSDNLLGLYDLFAGGAFSNAAIFALGIMPYISASIIIQLGGAIIPYFQKLQREGEEGRKKITQLTRYGTVIISLFQSIGVVTGVIMNLSYNGVSVVPVEVQGFGFVFTSVAILVAGTVFMMWIGEQITDKGIGNGISLIIFIGIINRLPFALLDEYRLIAAGTRNIVIEVVILALMVLIIAGIVLVTQGTRRIPVQYAKRVVGRKMYGGQSTHIPIKINMAGVIPIIFAMSIMAFPQTLSALFGVASSSTGSFGQKFLYYMGPDYAPYHIMYALLIIFFTYFYTLIMFNPVDVANNMKKNGGFIPGIRPGKATSTYLTKVVNRTTLAGSLFLAAVAVLPVLLNVILDIQGFWFGGTALLIVVGVAIETNKQIQSQIMMRHYKGFLQ